MSKGSIEFWVGVSWALAVLTAAAALFVCFGYGVVEVPGRYAMEKVVNWPLVVGCAVSAAYAVLFAVAMSIIKVSALNSRTTLELMLDRKKGEDCQP